MSQLSPPMLESHVSTLERIHQGEVRDIYAIDAHHMLIVTTDRLSAFDVVMPDPIPGKGTVLTRISHFWFERTKHIVPNHLTDYTLERAVPDATEREPLVGRGMVVRRLKALPIEAVVRGYLIGSGWRDYQETSAVCGLHYLTACVRPIGSPSRSLRQRPRPGWARTMNISYERMVSVIGRGLAEQVRATALSLYGYAAEHARARGIIVADTKFEFGIDEAGRLTLIDEVLTPDSSRFWPMDTWQPGASPPSLDKQFVRDYLERLDSNKRRAGSTIAGRDHRKTGAKYAEALRRPQADLLRHPSRFATWVSCHSCRISCMAATPSVRAAGPGYGVIGDLTSRA